MSNFWASRLGVPPPATTVQPPYQTTLPAQTVAQMPWWRGDAVVQATVAPTPASVQGDPLLGNPLAAAAQKHQANTNCPRCDDGMYLRGLNNAAAHCFSCGYSEKMGDATVGMGVSNTGGEATQTTRQTLEGGRGGHPNWHPTTVIARM